MKTNKDNTTEKFIPTMAQWWELRQKWEKKIASSLWRSGSPEDCQRAVQDAFDKIMGIHPDYELKDSPIPLYLGQWYKMVRRQAKWIIRHHHEHDNRATGYSTTDENEIGEFGLVEYDIDAVCREDLRREIRHAIVRACLKRGFGTKAIQGFFKTKFDGMSVREAIEDVTGTKSEKAENALNQCNFRIFSWLKEAAKDHSSELYKLWAA